MKKYIYFAAIILVSCLYYDCCVDKIAPLLDPLILAYMEGV